MLDIISCSRRTDIPAFYYDWLQQKLKDKYVDVRNPYHQRKYMVDLRPENVHSIVLWSKSYENVISNPGMLNLYNLYFQFTITGLAKVLEPHVIETNEAIGQMEKLSNIYSPRQINWRFDPVILSSESGKERLKVFNGLCKDIASFGINRCTISFLCLYKKVVNRMKTIGYKYINPNEQQQIDFLNRLIEIADKYSIKVYSCSSPAIENVSGINKSSCIDGKYLQNLFGKRASRAKDTGQRKECGCTKSKDIGDYNYHICRHGCVYCYAR